ncbi:cytochrome P450 [Boletus edulis]|nr:cytochrome P450 [Boletus edulis]
MLDVVFGFVRIVGLRLLPDSLAMALGSLFTSWLMCCTDKYNLVFGQKISSPAFNNGTYASVWDASSKLFAEMVSAQGWSSKDVVELPSIYSVMFKFSLAIFTSAGFGAPLAWSKPPSQGEGDNLSVLECLDIITNTLMFAVAPPSWDLGMETAFQMIPTDASSLRYHTRVHAIPDLFSLLVHASDDIGDVFSFSYAGHDTTAQDLTVTLAFLALNDELVSQIREVTEDRDNDTLLFEDYGKLDKVLAAFYEAIRISWTDRSPRSQDTVLNVSDTDEPRMLFVKKGSHVVVDLIGIHYHPRYYSDPEVYRPSRWYVKKQDRSSNVREGGDFTGFSFGPRSCIGRKYSTTEAVCFLANLLRDWQVEPLFLVRPNGKAESVDEWRERVFRADMMLTLGLKDQCPACAAQVNGKDAYDGEHFAFSNSWFSRQMVTILFRDGQRTFTQSLFSLLLFMTRFLTFNSSQVRELVRIDLSYLVLPKNQGLLPGSAGNTSNREGI